MAVDKLLTRKDVVILIGPLAELYDEAAPIIQNYLDREWSFESSKTNPNAGPSMELRFSKERVQDAG